MIRRPPRSTRTDQLFPYTTLFRSLLSRPCPGRDIGAAVLVPLLAVADIRCAVGVIERHVLRSFASQRPREFHLIGKIVAAIMHRGAVAVTAERHIGAMRVEPGSREDKDARSEERRGGKEGVSKGWCWGW